VYIYHADTIKICVFLLLHKAVHWGYIVVNLLDPLYEADNKLGMAANRYCIHQS